VSDRVRAALAALARLLAARDEETRAAAACRAAMGVLTRLEREQLGAANEELRRRDRE
jgi:hypothetical protein